MRRTRGHRASPLRCCEAPLVETYLRDELPDAAWRSYILPRARRPLSPAHRLAALIRTSIGGGLVTDDVARPENLPRLAGKPRNLNGSAGTAAQQERAFSCPLRRPFEGGTSV